MKSIKFLIIALVFSVLGFSFISKPAFADSDNNSSTNCAVNIVGDHANQFSVVNGIATAQVTVTGAANCSETVTLASWAAPIGVNGFLPLDSQKLVTSTTQAFGVGQHTISVKIADCMYQVDMLQGSKATDPNGNPDYAVAGSPQLIGWVQAGTKVCEPAPVTPVTPTTTPTVTPTATPVAPTDPQVQAAATVLPNTGPGSVIGIFAATTIIGTLVHRYGLRKLSSRA
jgi:hypothetical protein